MKAVYDKLILEKSSGEERSQSGLITLATNQKKGKVLAVGDIGKDSGIEVGETVYYSEGIDLSVDGKQVVIVSVDHILAVTPATPHLKAVQ